jgi:hypothetical protein
MGRAAKLKLSRSKEKSKIKWSELQTPFATLTSFGIKQVGSIRAGSDCCDRVSALQEVFPHLKAQVGVVLVRGYSDLPGHDGKECWDSLFQGHCWLIDPESGSIVDPSLDSFAEASPAMADFRPVKPLDQIQARSVNSGNSAEGRKLLSSAIDNLPQWGPFVDADLLYIPGSLDQRYLINPSSDGLWHLMAHLSKEGKGFDIHKLEDLIRNLSEQERRKMGIRIRAAEEANAIALFMNNY